MSMLRLFCNQYLYAEVCLLSPLACPVHSECNATLSKHSLVEVSSPIMGHVVGEGLHLAAGGGPGAGGEVEGLQELPTALGILAGLPPHSGQQTLHVGNGTE